MSALHSAHSFVNELKLKWRKEEGRRGGGGEEEGWRRGGGGVEVPLLPVGAAVATAQFLQPIPRRRRYRIEKGGRREGGRREEGGGRREEGGGRREEGGGRREEGPERNGRNGGDGSSWWSKGCLHYVGTIRCTCVS